MPDYSKGKIYCLRSSHTDCIYIGSTTQTLSQRFRDHKNDYKCWKDGKRHFISSFEILDFDDAYIELLEDCSCERKEQLLKREGQLIREMDCVNKFIPGRTDKEWREDNKVEIARKKKIWVNENRDSVLEKKRQYYCNNKEKYAEQYKNYRKENREKLAEYGKKWRENNKEKIKEKSQEYYRKTIEKRKEYCRKKWTCECGSIVSNSSKSNHLKSKKHKAFIEKEKRKIVPI
jgi:hypothetical protein